jgi:hypothetical protein
MPAGIVVIDGAPLPQGLATFQKEKTLPETDHTRLDEILLFLTAKRIDVS